MAGSSRCAAKIGDGPRRACVCGMPLSSTMPCIAALPGFWTQQGRCMSVRACLICEAPSRPQDPRTGECPDFGVLELARLLEEEPHERLVVRMLENMEVCGSGQLGRV